MKCFRIIIFLLCGFFALSSYAAPFQWQTKFKEKQGKKETTRWTLEEWLAQKDRVRLMDMWLALNTSANAFEFGIGADSTSYKYELNKNEEAPTYRLHRAHLLGYATIVGLEFQYLDALDEKSYGWNGTFHLRLLGTSNQSTHFNVFYGTRYRSELENEERFDFQNSFAGARICLYFTKHFGIQGEYQQILLTEKSDQSNLKGQYASGTIFIDYNFLRLYGEIFNENLTLITPAETENELLRSGTHLGFKIFF